MKSLMIMKLKKRQNSMNLKNLEDLDDEKVFYADDNKLPNTFYLPKLDPFDVLKVCNLNGFCFALKRSIYFKIGTQHTLISYIHLKH